MMSNGRPSALPATLVMLALAVGCEEAPPKETPAAAQSSAATRAKPAAAPAKTRQMPTLIAAKASAVPKLDGAIDEVWSAGKELVVKVMKGSKMTEVKLRALYDDKQLYLLAVWPDKDDSKDRHPWRYNGKSWERLPKNTHNEDKLALLWNIDDSIARFNERGCAAVCHAMEGKKHTGSAAEKGDMWHWKRVRTQPAGQADDKYLTDEKGGGRKGDAKTSGGYRDNVNEKGNGPKYRWEGDYDPLTAFAKNAKEISADDNFAAGTKVPGVVVEQFVGSRGDLRSGAKWDNGSWTLEIARALVTGHDDDVQLSDLAKGFTFGVATFDNHSTAHATSRVPLRLKFANK